MTLAGKRILVVEDEMLVAMHIEDCLLDLGAVVVGPAMRVETALELAKTADYDVAILDVNLDGGRSYPVAAAIRERGLPFMFATGYGHTEDGEIWKNIMTLAKPFRSHGLKQALESAMGLSLPTSLS